jgi:hypothetical protein
MGRVVRRRATSWLAVLGLLLSLMLVSTLGGAAQAACTVFASGLMDPRGIAVAGDGTVYVTEAGTGGTEQLPAPPGGEPGEPTGTRGLTGQITAIAANGTKTVVAKNLPSYGGAGEANGANGIVAAGGALWVSVGGAGPATALLTPLANENSLVRINPQTGAVEKVADIGANEKANNPEPYAVDSNLYGLALGADGMVYVADAGGNALYKVNPNGGQLSVVAVIPGVPVSAEELPPGQPAANPFRGGKAELDPVPTGVAVGPDGIYVGNLPGALMPGKGRVVRVSLDGKTVTEVATGLTTVVDVERGPDGMLYVSQLASAIGPPTAPNGPPDIKPGNVVRVMPNGQTQVAVPNLPFANGIAFDAAGNLYVATNSVNFGPPGPPNGQVMKCTGVAAAAPTTPPAPPAPAPPPAPQPPAPQPPMPGLPNTGAGGGQSSTALLVLFGVAAAFGAALVARRRYARD